MEYMSVYDQSGGMLAVLDNAEYSYELKHNDLWTGSFSLPSADSKNDYCQAHNLVKLPDGPRKTGLYRIIGMPDSDETSLGGLREYSIEHVMATLLDDVLFGYHEVGGTGVSTRQVMEYILAHQTVKRWQVGVVEFEDYYQYHFENDSLLAALLSLGNVLADEYTWEFDTETTPWTVNLKRADAAAGCGIYYQRNLTGIEKSMDATTLITRLYPLGYGEGVNQLTIEGVNGGLPYIDADTVGAWGVKCSVWTDTRIQDAETLLARARQVLEGYKNPYISYTAKALDLYKQTGYSWDDFMPGKLVRVMDGAHGISFEARIVAIRKKDVNGDPGDIEITIANAPRDAADSINSLADRVGIGELYSQGATNLYAVPFADNADPTHPAKMRVFVPEGLVRINKMLLSWQVAAFRAYETGAAAGGSTERTTTSGGGTTETTTSGGATRETTSSGGGTTETTTSGGSTRETTSSGGGTTETTTSGGRVLDTTGSGGGTTETTTSGGLTRETTSSGGGTTETTTSGGHVLDTTGSGGATTETTSSGGGSTETTTSGGHVLDTTGSGGSSTETSDAGGGSTQTTSTNARATHTSASGGGTTITQEQRVITSEGGAGTPITNDTDQYRWGTSGPVDWYGNSKTSTASAGAHKHSGPDHQHGLNAHMHKFSGSDSVDYVPTTVEISGNTGAPWNTDHTGSSGTGDTSEAAAHSHSFDHTHEFIHRHNVTVGVTIPAQTITIPSHTHDVTIPAHSHTVDIPSHTHDVDIPDHTHSVDIPSHTHDVTIPDHTHSVDIPNHTHSIDIPNHAHDVTIPDHTHSVDIPGHTHDVTIPDHTHSVDIPSHTHDVTIPDHTHSVDIPDHTHDVTIPDHSHDVTIPDHTHGMVYGIYEGGQADTVAILVDGSRVPSSAITEDELDVSPWLSKDENGKITRGTWHEIIIQPDKLTRIEANLFMQCFVQSVGGGDY